MDLPLQVPSSPSPGGPPCDSNNHVCFAIVFYEFQRLHCKNLCPPLPWPLPAISTPDRHGPPFTVSGNKRDVEVDVKTTGLDSSVTPWSPKKKKKPQFFNVLNHIKPLSCPAFKRTKSCQIPEIFHDLFLPQDHIRNAGLTQSRNLGKVPAPPSIFHFSDTQELLGAKCHGNFFSLHLTAFDMVDFCLFPKKHSLSFFPLLWQ